MSRTSKTKIDIHAEMPLQLIPGNPMEEPVVTVVDSSTSNAPLERRKEEASKPLYLKRV